MELKREPLLTCSPALMLEKQIVICERLEMGKWRPSEKGVNKHGSVRALWR